MSKHDDEQRIEMTTEEAIQLAIKNFPFEGYMTPAKTEKGAYRNIADTVQRFLQPGSSVLDFGCGPCGKIAMLQYLGY
jgi:hypothetical protein